MVKEMLGFLPGVHKEKGWLYFVGKETPRGLEVGRALMQRGGKKKVVVNGDA